MKKRKKCKKAEGMLIITIMIGVVIGVIAMSVIWGQITSQTSTTTRLNDTFTGSNTTCVAVTDNCIASFTSLTNGSTQFGTANLTKCQKEAPIEHYDGVIIVSDAQSEIYLNARSLNLSYTEESCSKLTGTTKTLVDYVPILFATAILVFVAGFIAFKR